MLSQIILRPRSWPGAQRRSSSGLGGPSEGCAVQGEEAQISRCPGPGEGGEEVANGTRDSFRG